MQASGGEAASHAREAGDRFSRPGPVRSAALTLLVASALTGLAFGGAWGLQRTALAGPARSSRLAVDVVRWLARYRLAESEIHVAGRPKLHAVCLSGWLPAPTRVGVDRGVLLELEDGTTLLAVHRGIEVLARTGPQPRELSVVELQLAGCTRELAGRVAARIQKPGGVHVRDAVVGDSPALAVRVATPTTRIAVFARPRTLVPFAVEVHGGRYSGTSRIALTPLRPGRLGAILARAGLVPKRLEP